MFLSRKKRICVQNEMKVQYGIILMSVLYSSTVSLPSFLTGSPILPGKLPPNYKTSRRAAHTCPWYWTVIAGQYICCPEWTENCPAKRQQQEAITSSVCPAERSGLAVKPASAVKLSVNGRSLFSLTLSLTSKHKVMWLDLQGDEKFELRMRSPTSIYVRSL